MADWRKHIAISADICHGKPCFRGTRIMVSTALEFLEAGQPFSEIKAAYPRLTRRHIQAALQFARESVESGRVAAFHHARHALPY